MFIKNQTFKDEETLLEMLFDFGLGQASALLQGMIAEIDKELERNTTYIAYYASLQDSDDRAELYTEERDLRLAERLMDMFDSFMVQNASLYGMKMDEQKLLYTMDLH
ncbi:MAG: hypothetical protein BGO69_06210 [Bacteroidetes bacterium 46-16]|nr:MAG: hypothetical protein BGO69_06210 [Bacteroidetes bacterium 46-16]